MVKRKRMMVPDVRLWAKQSECGVCKACRCEVNLKNYRSHTHSLMEVDAQGKEKALQRRLNFFFHELCLQEEKGGLFIELSICTSFLDISMNRGRIWLTTQE